MKLAEIEVGSFYAVRVNPGQVQGLRADPEDLFSEPAFVARWLIADVGDKALRGIKAEVVAIEQVNERRKVRVKATARKARLHERNEDNYDGTTTQWRGLVVDTETEDPIEDDVAFEALIEPAQVVMPWTDAFVETEMRRATRILDHDRERYFS